MSHHKKSVTVGGRTLTFESGQIARQANGAVLLTMGDTVIFSSACAKFKMDKRMDFLPLRVDYQEKFSSAGKSLGGFVKREGRPSERETLVSRLTDRSIRPMFEDGYYGDTQVLSYVWSYDPDNQPEPLSLCAASAALYISDIPFHKPMAGVRVGMIDGKFLINPSKDQMAESQLDLLMAGTEDAVLMIEGNCDFLNEDQVIESIYTGQEAIKGICIAIKEWGAEIGKEKNTECVHCIPEECMKAVEEIASPLLPAALKITDKAERDAALAVIKTAVTDKLLPENVEEHLYESLDVYGAIKEASSRNLRKTLLDESIRCDGRAPNEIRQISIQQSMLPRAHGSSLFTRGETQAMAVCTLGGDSMGQRFEDLDKDSTRQFYLQYSFPPFSVGEVGRAGPAGRREIGHGKLAERALLPVVPSREAFPYTIRLESNITESNGSSSMASVCGGCLSMMDAGVPIKRPISGIAMGLVLEGDRHVILSDILGIEDALGDMDFKIAGDAEGITTFQMDIKVEGITAEVMYEALKQAKEGRAHILEKMLEVCPKPRGELASHAPRIAVVRVHPSKIGMIIGPGGKQIRAIIEETGADIDINDEGIISIASPNGQSLDRAKKIIEGLTAEVEIGKTYEGKVVTITNFGMFVEVLPGKEGLCHISEYSHERINDLNDHVKPGEMINVKVLDINERGQMKLSRKALLEKAQA